MWLQYSFGYGLSYTTFSLQNSNATSTGGVRTFASGETFSRGGNQRRESCGLIRRSGMKDTLFVLPLLTYFRRSIY